MSAIRTAAILACLSFGTVEAQQPPAPRMDELTILGLSPEADSVEIVRRLGRPDSARKRDYPATAGVRLLSLFYRTCVIRLGPDGRKSGITIVRRGPATARGLRVGDQVSRVETLYGRPGARSTTEWRYDIEGDEYGPQLILTLARGRVTQIYVGYPLE